MKILICFGLIFSVLLVAQDSPSDLIAAELQKRVPKSTSRTYRVALDNFVELKSKLPTPLSQYLMAETTVALSKCPFFVEYARRDLDKLLNEQHTTVSDLFDQSEAPLVGQLKSVQGIFFGSYTQHLKGVDLYLKIQDVATGKNRGSIKVRIPNKMIPMDLYESEKELKKTKSAVDSLAIPKKAITSPDFKIKVSTNRGKNAVYRVGDDLTIFFETTKECYLKIYYLSAKGEIQLIYPESYEARQTFAPGKIHKIEYTAEEPIGIEYFKAVALLSPFEQVEEVGEILGKVDDKGEVLERITKRGYRGAKRKPVMAEDMSVYRIVK